MKYEMPEPLAPERYMLMVKYVQTAAFVPIPSGWLAPGSPDGGSFDWDKAVELRGRIRGRGNSGNQYMIMPIIADPI